MTDARTVQPSHIDELSRTSWQILEAVSYIEQCLKANRGFAIVTADAAAVVHLAINRFLAGRSVPLRVARIRAPTDSSHVFLEAVLAQLGFESFTSTTDDLLRLLTVVMRQRAVRQDPICIIVEDAQDFGPRVFETMRDLARNARDELWAPLFVLGGKNGLQRVLDSKGMSSVADLTRHRFDFASAPVAGQERSTRDSQPKQAGPELVLSLDQEPLRRFPVDSLRILIGRGQHCDICIRSRFVSRQHALLIRSSDGDWLVDLKSTNGTSVNAQLITQRRLAHGDVISIGTHRLRYRNPSGRRIEGADASSQDQIRETLMARSAQAANARPDPVPRARYRKPTAA